MSTIMIPSFFMDEMQRLSALSICSQSHTFSMQHGKFKPKDALKNVDSTCKEFVGRVYAHISSAATRGKKEISFEEEVTISNGAEAAVHFAALRSFESFDINFTPPIYPEKAHSQICQLLEQKGKSQKISLTASWKTDNPVFAPKILAPFEKDPLLPPARLNEDRKTGKKTDCSIVLGPEVFPVHSLFIKRFCPHFRMLFENHLGEGSKDLFSDSFSGDLNGLTREELDQLVSWMYGQPFNLHVLGISKSLQLLKWSLHIESDSLIKHCLAYLLKDPHQHSNEERLHLLFLLSNQPSKELQRITNELIERRPTFFTPLLDSESIASEHLLMLFDLVNQPQLGPLKERLEAIWNEMTIEEKTGFATEALVTGRPVLIKKIRQLSDAFLESLPPEKKDIDEESINRFFEVYRKLTKEAVRHQKISLRSSSSSPLPRSADSASPLLSTGDPPPL